MITELSLDTLHFLSVRTRTRKSRKNINFPLSALSHRLITLDHKLIMKLSDRRASNKRYYLSLGIIAAPTRSQYAHNRAEERWCSNKSSDRITHKPLLLGMVWKNNFTNDCLGWKRTNICHQFRISGDSDQRLYVLIFKWVAEEKTLRSIRQRCCVSDSIKVPKFKS